MGRIAYLSRRGNIWWFRRRFPVIFIDRPQNDPVSGLCCGTTIKTQAAGHLAISLKTSSLREARLIGSQVSADFERAWSWIEAKMSENGIEGEMLDAIAMAMANGFRSYIGALRTGIAAGQDPRIKEKAYRIIETDLRNALNIAPPAPSDEPADNISASSTSPDKAGWDGTIGQIEDFPPDDEY